ncbi:uncharacterized protein [Miscanthus floridulus]|uniref:uncharacterized protein n=1 Tax=Miscanthus floridulus TaxID=154761 RepID=UPI0034591412
MEQNDEDPATGGFHDMIEVFSGGHQCIASRTTLSIPAAAHPHRAPAWSWCTLICQRQPRRPSPWSSRTSSSTTTMLRTSSVTVARRCVQAIVMQQSFTAYCGLQEMKSYLRRQSFILCA